MARWRSVKAMAIFIRHGRNLIVCGISMEFDKALGSRQTSVTDTTLLEKHKEMSARVVALEAENPNTQST
jgi:hypothetical protein